MSAKFTWMAFARPSLYVPEASQAGVILEGGCKVFLFVAAVSPEVHDLIRIRHIMEYIFQGKLWVNRLR
jgi:hypothetical protein